MKKIFFPFALISLLFIAGCQKESTSPPPNNNGNNNGNNNTTPADPYKMNDSLIKPGSQCYFIADVEGLSGVTKIIRHNTDPHVSIGYGGGTCTTGSCHYSGSFGISNTAYGPWYFGIDFYGMGETREELYKQSFASFFSSANKQHGVRFIYATVTGATSYNSALLDNSKVTWSKITLLETVPSGGNPPYYLKFHFDCQLKDDYTGAIINIKNGVARVKI